MNKDFNRTAEKLTEFKGEGASFFESNKRAVQSCSEEDFIGKCIFPGQH